MPNGASLRRRRDAANLTQEALAARAGVSLRSVQRYESGDYPRGDNDRLIEAALAEIERAASNPPSGPPSSWPTWYVEETYDPLRTAAEYAQIIRTANGAAVDNRWLWSTPQQCSDWLELVRTGQTWQERLLSWPYRAVAQEVMRAVTTKDVDVIAVGPGLATAEVNLVRELQLAGARVRVALVDLSWDMLVSGARHIGASLPDVQVCGIHGEGYHVDRWPWLVATGRSRVWLCLGHPAHDLTDIDGLHRAAQPGDVVVADICGRCDEIELSAGMGRWIGRALQRLGIDGYELGMTSSRGGYPVIMLATATIGGRHLRLGRTDLRGPAGARDEASGKGFATIATLPAMRATLADGDVWIGRRARDD